MTGRAARLYHVTQRSVISAVVEVEAQTKEDAIERAKDGEGDVIEEDMIPKLLTSEAEPMGHVHT